MAILADQPFCSVKLGDQLSGLLCQYSSFSRTLQQRWPLRSGSARCACDDRRAHYRSAPGPAVAVFESGNCACVKISLRVWGILGDGIPVTDRLYIFMIFHFVEQIALCLKGMGELQTSPADTLEEKRQQN